MSNEMFGIKRMVNNLRDAIKAILANQYLRNEPLMDTKKLQELRGYLRRWENSLIYHRTGDKVQEEIDKTIYPITQLKCHDKLMAVKKVLEGLSDIETNMLNGMTVL